MSGNESHASKRRQLILSVVGNDSQLRAAMFSVMHDIDHGQNSREWSDDGIEGAGSFVVLETARPPIEAKAVISAELLGELDRHSARDPDAWEEATRGEGDGVGF